MKRFVKIVSLFLAIILIITIVPAVVIDPYNIIHWSNIRDNGIEPDKNYIKTKYIIENPEKFDTYMFGSSRVGAIHTEKIKGEKVYNMTYSEGVPYDHLDTIKTFVENNVKIKKIYMGVDSLSYTTDGRQHKSNPMRCPYSELHNNFEVYFNIYCNPKVNFLSLYTTYFKQNKAKINSEQFYNFGWHHDYNKKTTINWEKAKASIGAAYLLDETIEDIKEIKELCEKNKIELVVFTNPMYEKTYKASVEHDYFKFLKKLSEVTDYYNFSGLNDVTTNTDYFIDASHYNAYVGDMIMNVITEGKKYEDLYKDGFGRYVTKDTVDELIGILKSGA